MVTDITYDTDGNNLAIVLSAADRVPTSGSPRPAESRGGG